MDILLQVSVTESVEIAKIMFEAALVLSAILMAVIGILFAEYHSAKRANLGGLILKNYRRLTYGAVGILAVSTISSLLFLFYLQGVNLYWVALGLFIFAIVSIVALAIIVILTLMK